MLISSDKFTVTFIKKRGEWYHWGMVGIDNFKVVGKRRCSDMSELEDKLNKFLKRNRGSLPKFSRFSGGVAISNEKTSCIGKKQEPRPVNS